MLSTGNIWTEIQSKAGNPWTFAEIAQFLRKNDNLRQLVNLLETVYLDDKVEMFDPTILTRILLAVKSYSSHHATMLAAEIIDLHEFLEKISNAGPNSTYWDWLCLEKQEERKFYVEEKRMLDEVEPQPWMLPAYSDCLQRELLPPSRVTEFKPLTNVKNPIEFELPKVQIKTEGRSSKARSNEFTSQRTKEKAFKTFFKDPGKQTLASNPRKRKAPPSNRPIFQRPKRARALTLEDVEKMKAEERIAIQRKENLKKEAQLKKQHQKKRRTKVSRNPALDMKKKVDAEKLKKMVAQGFVMGDPRMMANQRWALGKNMKGMNPSYSHLPHMNPAYVVMPPSLSSFQQTPGVPLPNFRPPPNIFSVPQFPIPNAGRKHAFKKVPRQASSQTSQPPGVPPPMQPIPQSEPPPMQSLPVSSSHVQPPPLQPNLPPKIAPHPSRIAPQPVVQKVPEPNPTPQARKVPIPAADPFSEQHHSVFRKKLPFLYEDCPDISIRHRTEILKLLLGKAHMLGSGEVDILLDRTNGVYLKLNTVTKNWKKIQRKAT